MPTRHATGSHGPRTETARAFGLGIGVIAVSALVGCSEQPAPVQKLPVRVKVMTAKPSDYERVLKLTGVIAARKETNVAFRTGGRVAERMAEIGDHVAAGALLARLDPQEQQSDIRAAQASVDAAQAGVSQATASFARQQQLMRQGFTTRRDFDQAQQSLSVAQASLQSAQSQLQNTRDALGFTELRAAAAGIVTARNIEAGQVVQAAQTVYTIAEDGDRDAVFNVGEGVLAVAPPKPPTIDLTLLSDPSITAKGTPRELSPVVDPQTGTIRVKVAIPDTPPQMALGAAVSGSMTARAIQAVVLPWPALFSDKGAPAVWTVDTASKTVALKPVQIATYGSGAVAIGSGLEQGEVVVTAGAQLLRPGLTVETVEEAAP